MKFFALAFLLFSTLALGAAQVSIVPNSATEFSLNSGMGAMAHKHRLGSLMKQAHSTAHGVYDYSLTGGAVGAHAVGITLPANAIVRDVLFDVVTAPVGTNGTISFNFRNPSDLKAGTGVASWTGRVAGIPVGTAATAVKSTTSRSIYASIENASLTAGKIKIFVDYVVSE
jgi:hypothetical protein